MRQEFELLNKCRELGYSNELIIEFVIKNKRSEQVNKRFKSMTNDLLSNQLRTLKYYSDLFGVSVAQSQADKKFIIRKLKWLIGFYDQYGEVYLHEKGITGVDVRYLNL